MKLIRILYIIAIINYIVLLVASIAEERWSLMIADIGLVIWSSVAWAYSERTNEQRYQIKVYNEMVCAQQELIKSLKSSIEKHKEINELNNTIIKGQEIIIANFESRKDENTDKNS